MENKTYNKTELDRINDCIDYLVGVSRCSREQAVLALYKHGVIQTSFSLLEISKLLDLPSKTVKHCSAKAEYQINKSVKEDYLADFKDYLLSISGDNFEMCLTNFGNDLRLED